MTEKIEKDIIEEKDTNIIIVAVIVTIVITALWFLSYYLLKDYPIAERGNIGDMFGTVNSLFSGLALSGIILTILLQKKELKLQREELKQTRKEFKTQNQTLKIQRFENTFFSLLNQHHQIVNTIDYRYYKSKEKDRKVFGPVRATTNSVSEEKEVVIINGRDVFRFRYNQMLKILVEEENENKYKEIYMKYYEEAQTDFGHYFRNLYRMLKIVDETDFFYEAENISTVEIFETKYSYTSIIRSQISDYELLWIFYNCLSSNGNEKFKPLIEKYSFFKNIPLNLIGNINHITMYQEQAFKPKK